MIDARERQVNPLYFTIGALCDFIGSSLVFYGLQALTPSLYSILRNMQIPFIIALSYFLLGRRYKTIQWVSMVIVGIGLIITAVSGILDFDRITSFGSQSEKVVGEVTMIIGALFLAMTVCLREYILQRLGGGQEASFMIGWEGVWGILITFIIAVIAQHSSCPFPANQCVGEHIDDARIFAE